MLKPTAAHAALDFYSIGDAIQQLRNFCKNLFSAYQYQALLSIVEWLRDESRGNNIDIDHVIQTLEAVRREVSWNKITLSSPTSINELKYLPIYELSSCEHLLKNSTDKALQQFVGYVFKKCDNNIVDTLDFLDLHYDEDKKLYYKLVKVVNSIYLESLKKQSCTYTTWTAFFSRTTREDEAIASFLLDKFGEKWSENKTFFLPASLRACEQGDLGEIAKRLKK